MLDAGNVHSCYILTQPLDTGKFLRRSEFTRIRPDPSLHRIRPNPEAPTQQCTGTHWRAVRGGKKAVHCPWMRLDSDTGMNMGRGLHSSTSQLNLSALYEIRGALRDFVARVEGLLRSVWGV